MTDHLLGNVLVQHGHLSPDQLAEGLAQALPLAVDEGTLTVALGNPMDLQVVDDLRLATGMAVRPVVAPPAEIRRALEQLAMERMIQDVSDGEAEAGADEGADIADLQKM